MKYIIAFILLFSHLCLFGENTLTAFDGQPAIEKAIFPFHYRNGAIYIEIRINHFERPLCFIIDSGAESMAIKKSLADSIGLKITRKQKAQVVGGSLRVPISTGNTVHLCDSLSLENQTIAIFDQLVSDADGIIGLNLARQYIVRLDFEKEKMQLFTFGDYTFGNSGEILKLDRHGSIMLVPACLMLTGDEEYHGHFALDTGAAYHLICFSNFVHKHKMITNGFKPEGRASTISMGQITPVYMGTAKVLRFGNTLKETDIPVALQISPRVKGNKEKIADGSIGIEVLKDFVFTLDLNRSIIHLAPIGRE